MKKIIATLSLILIFTTGFSQAFVTIWNTRNDSFITIPGSGINYNVNWEHVGKPSHNGSLVTTNNTVINFGDTGTYKISISGGNPAFNRIHCKILSSPDLHKLLSVVSWGNIHWTTMSEAFYGCPSLTTLPNSPPDLSGVTDMSYMFYFAQKFNSDISNWDISNVKNLRNMFAGAFAFNQPLNNWNTSNVTDMAGIFTQANKFNQNIGNWNISHINTSISLNYSGIDQNNYDSILMMWSLQPAFSIILGAQNLSYCNAATQRNRLINNNGWTIGGDTLICPLPITATSFTATPSQSKVLLQWQTATETNNNFFTVQRSSNKGNWQDIVIVKGAGNSSVAKEYISTDNNPLQGISYYRIKQTDFNGSVSYSEVRQVELGIRNLGINVYPNPAKDFVNITATQSLWLSVYDIFGKIVLTQKLNAGDNRVNTTNLSSGLYLVEAKGINTAYTTKLLITQ